VPTIIIDCVYVAAYTLLKHTRFGRYVYAVGGTRKRQGSQAQCHKDIALRFIISGVLSAMSGVLLAFQDELRPAQRRPDV